MKFIIQSKNLKRLFYFFLGGLLFINVIAFFHAYRFTHFVNSDEKKTKNSQELALIDKFKLLAFGITNPRPENNMYPRTDIETITIQGKKYCECWLVRVNQSKGTVILFHGYGGQKSSLLDKAEIFNLLGYNTLLVDFMGSGGSEGNQTTIGFFEAEQVKDCFNFIVKSGEKKIFLFGTSMGAVAILKAIDKFKLKTDGIIIECPFGSMYKTVCARFDEMRLPSFPMAGLLVFWGGIQNGFWAFGHNPIRYAEGINCPVLLMYGGKDSKVSKSEIDEIYSKIKTNKRLVVFPLAGHENYLLKYKHQWKLEINEFLNKY